MNFGNKKLSINLVTNLLSFLISVALSFFITPFLVNSLGKEMYGFYGIANIFINYIAIIALTFNSMAAKYITIELAKNNENKAKRYFSSIFFSNVLLCIALIPILVALVVFLEYVLSISAEYVFSVKVLFSLIFGAMLVSFVTSIFGCATYAKNRTDISAYVTIGKSIVKLVLYMLLFYAFKPSIIYVGIVILLIEIYNCFIQIKLCSKLLPQFKIRKEYFDLSLVKDTVKVGIWNSVNQLGDLLLSSSDLYISNILLGEIASGNISIIKTMPTLISVIISSINSVFTPIVALVYAKEDKNELINEIQKAQRTMGTIVTPIVIMLIIFGYDFYSLWVPGNDIALLASLSALDLIRMALIGIVWPIVSLNIITDKVKIPSIMVSVSGALNILSMFLLVKWTDLGVYSIAITTLVLTIAYYGFFIPIYASKILKIQAKAFYRVIVRMIICCVILLLVFGPIHNMLEINTWFEFVFYGGACGLVGVIISALCFLGDAQIKDLVIRFTNRLKGSLGKSYGEEKK